MSIVGRAYLFYVGLADPRSDGRVPSGMVSKRLHHPQMMKHRHVTEKVTALVPFASYSESTHTRFTVCRTYDLPSRSVQVALHVVHWQLQNMRRTHAGITHVSCT